MADEETVASELPADAEAAPADTTAPAPQATESDTATDPAETQRREEEKARARENASRAAARQRERELKSELERERSERQALTQRLLQGQQQPTAQAEGLPDPAKYAGGEFNPDYIRELTRYETRQLLQAEREAMTKREQESAAKRNADTARQGWTKSVTEAQGKYSDWEVIVEAGAADIPNAAKQLLVGLKDGAELLYHLAKEPEKAQALTGNPVEIAAALGELRAEARYAAKQAKAVATPEPIKPGNGGGRSGGEPDPTNTDAWMRWRAKQG